MIYNYKRYSFLNCTFFVFWCACALKNDLSNGYSSRFNYKFSLSIRCELANECNVFGLLHIFSRCRECPLHCDVKACALVLDNCDVCV